MESRKRSYLILIKSTCLLHRIFQNIDVTSEEKGLGNGGGTSLEIICLEEPSTLYNGENC